MASQNTHHDGNHVPVLAAVSSADGKSIVLLWADPITHRLLTSAGVNLSVTDGTTTVASVSELDFTSGATVTDGGGGIAQIAITGGGGGGTTGAWYAVTGTIDGSNATFTIPVTPVGDIILVLDGQVQIPTTWYTISGTTITYQAGSIPVGVSTNVHKAYIFTGTISGTTYTETPSGLINGSNTTYTTTHTINLILVFSINGQVLYNGVDFTFSGTTITFTTALDASLSGKPFQITYQ